MGVRNLLAGAAAALALGLASVGAAGPAALAETVLNRGNGPAPATIDPHLATAAVESRIIYDLFEGLFTVGSEGLPVPGVAERYEVSPDGITYTFHLRANAKWSDGKPVTSEDFAFSWRRLVDPKTAAEYAYFLWPVKNGEKISRGQVPPSELGVATPDPRTFVVTLEKPAAYFLVALQHRSTYPLQKAQVERDGTAYLQPGKLASNGAYRLEAFTPQTSVKLVRNEQFHGAKDVKIDTVYHHMSDSQDTELRRFRAGELDTVVLAPSTQVDWLKENLPKSIAFHPVMQTWYLAFNMTKEPWASNPKLRQALALAIDREALADKVAKGGELPLYTFTAPGPKGYTAPLPDWANLAQAERDKQAQALLKEAGYGPGGKPLRVDLLYSTQESRRRVAIAVATMWKQKLGVDTVLENQEQKVQLNTSREKNYPGLSLLTWLGDYPDPLTFLMQTYGRTGKGNFSGFKDPQYDRMVDEAESITDPAIRLSKLAQAEAYMLAQQPVVPLMVGSFTTLVGPRVKGYKGNPMGVVQTRFLSVE